MGTSEFSTCGMKPHQHHNLCSAPASANEHLPLLQKDGSTGMGDVRDQIKSEKAGTAKADRHVSYHSCFFQGSPGQPGMPGKDGMKGEKVHKSTL